MDAPTPVPGFIRRKFMPLYVAIMWISVLPALFFEYYVYWQYLVETLAAAWPGWILVFWVLMPFNLLFAFYLTILVAAVLARLLVGVLNLIHAPREGVFAKSPADKDYYFWGLRNLVRKWPFFLLGSLPFPWLKGRFILRLLGVRVQVGHKCSLMDGLITPEFVEIGDHVVVGQSAVIMSHMLEGDKFIVRKVTLETGAIVGAGVTVLPGTTVGKHATVAAESWTLYHARLDDYGVYQGKPAKQVGAVPAEVVPQYPEHVNPWAFIGQAIRGPGSLVETITRPRKHVPTRGLMLLLSFLFGLYLAALGYTDAVIHFDPGLQAATERVLNIGTVILIAMLFVGLWWAFDRGWLYLWARKLAPSAAGTKEDLSATISKLQTATFSNLLALLPVLGLLRLAFGGAYVAWNLGWIPFVTITLVLGWHYYSFWFLGVETLRGPRPVDGWTLFVGCVVIVAVVGTLAFLFALPLALGTTGEAFITSLL